MPAEPGDFSDCRTSLESRYCVSCVSDFLWSLRQINRTRNADILDYFFGVTAHRRIEPLLLSGMYFNITSTKEVKLTRFIISYNHYSFSVQLIFKNFLFLRLLLNFLDLVVNLVCASTLESIFLWRIWPETSSKNISKTNMRPGNFF